jgi:uncharacterized protein YjbI with pentapeptide repeats
MISSRTQLLHVDYLEEENIADLELEEHLIENKEFYDCTFQRCNFFKSRFVGCRVEACTFEDCDLSAARVTNSIFIDSSFVRSKASGINWAEMRKFIGSLSFSFVDSNVNYASFMELNIKGSLFINCVARDINFCDANLSNTIFKNTDLSGTHFLRTNLTEADFSDAHNYAIDPANNSLKGAIFSAPEVLSLLHSLGIIIR